MFSIKNSNKKIYKKRCTNRKKDDIIVVMRFFRARGAFVFRVRKTEVFSMENKKAAAPLPEDLPALRREYENYKALSLKLDMSRGKPDKAQLSLSQGLLTALTNDADTTVDGIDCRNYGAPDGIPGVKQLFADLLGLPVFSMFIGGGSSLEMMFDTVARLMLFGALPGMTPWGKQGEIRFLCPSPGYDRHFAICEAFGIRMIPVKMQKDGPDMDAVESLVKDPSVKGIWCVPKYSNPTGVTFSDEVVRRFAALSPAAEDFRIFWDNAYAIHDLYDEGETLLNLYDELVKRGKADMLFEFASFSKVTYAGGSVSMMASGEKSIAYAKSIIAKQIICTDKINQLRHLRYFGNADNVRAHMKEHAAILRPKFEAVLKIFDEDLGGVGVYTRPKGGYFISLDLPAGTAKRTYTLAAEAGVKLTSCGATFPYGVDPLDSNLRIAPSFPPIDELRTAAKVLCVCAKIAFLEKQTKE